MFEFEKTLEITNSLNILYVDNDLDTVEASENLYEDIFKTVDIALSGEIALEKYLTYKSLTNNYYDFVIANVEMPIVNGIELIYELKKINQQQVIFINTGYTKDETYQKFKNIKINGLISKPFELEATMSLFFMGLFKNLCQSGKITNTQGNTDEDRNRCRAVCS